MLKQEMMSCGVERETLGFHLYLILFWGKPNMQFLNLETFLKMITLVKIELKEIYSTWVFPFF